MTRKVTISAYDGGLFHSWFDILDVEVSSTIEAFEEDVQKRLARLYPGATVSYSVDRDSGEIQVGDCQDDIDGILATLRTIAHELWH